MVCQILGCSEHRRRQRAFQCIRDTQEFRVGLAAHYHRRRPEDLRRELVIIKPGGGIGVE